MDTKLRLRPYVWLALLTCFGLLAVSPAVAQNENGVTLYERINQDNSGAHRVFPVGTYQQSAADIKFMAITSSIKVPDGYEVWLCDKSPNSGGRICESHFEGNYNLSNRLSRRFSYLDVQYNQSVKTGNVCLNAGFNQMGLNVCFGFTGLQQLANFKFEHPANFNLPNVGDWRNKASSIWVKVGYSAEVCTNRRVIILPNHQSTDSNCTTFGAGEHNFGAAVNNQSIRVTINRTVMPKWPPAPPPVKGKTKIFLPSRKT